MRCAVLLLFLSTAPAVWSQTAGQGGESPAELIGRCAQSAEDETGLAELEVACPGLTRALEDFGYLPFISSEKREELVPYDLLDLQQLGERYRAPAAAPALDDATLQPILDSLRKQQAERPLTWLERLKRWVRRLLERRQQDSDSWLARWLEDIKISDAASMAILYSSIVLVVILALAVLINELRVAGVLRRRRSAHESGVADQMHGLVLADGTAVDLDAAAPEARAPLLLRMLVSTLVRSGRLRTERSLTHRELGLRAAFDDAEQRECFQRLAALAERVVYGANEISPAEFEPIVAAGRALNARLGGATS